MSEQNVLKILRNQLNVLGGVRQYVDVYGKLKEWHAATRPYIGRFFPGELPIFDEYLKVQLFAVHPKFPQTEEKNERAVLNAIDRLTGLLGSLIKLEEMLPAAKPVAVLGDNSTDTATASPRIFIVHGHDDEMKQSVARTLEKLGLIPVILHEQPNEGKTIIEKFEKNADVGFAVVLLSPDDRVFSTVDSPTEAKPCARQNVVLELGYFVGRLSRSRVFCLKRGDDLQIPSDFHGVVYTPYDPNGNWGLSLVKELQEAGYAVDANKLIR